MVDVYSGYYFLCQVSTTCAIDGRSSPWPGISLEIIVNHSQLLPQ